MTFKARAQDNLDLTVVVDVCLQKLRYFSKTNFSRVTETYISRLTKKRNLLERKLLSVTSKSSKGIIEYFYKKKVVSRIKDELRLVNESIVQIINSIYKYFSFNGK